MGFKFYRAIRFILYVGLLIGVISGATGNIGSIRRSQEPKIFLLKNNFAVTSTSTSTTTERNMEKMSWTNIDLKNSTVTADYLSQTLSNSCKKYGVKVNSSALMNEFQTCLNPIYGMLPSLKSHFKNQTKSNEFVLFLYDFKLDSPTSNPFTSDLKQWFKINVIPKICPPVKLLTKCLNPVNHESLNNCVLNANETVKNEITFGFDFETIGTIGINFICEENGQTFLDIAIRDFGGCIVQYWPKFRGCAKLFINELKETCGSLNTLVKKCTTIMGIEELNKSCPKKSFDSLKVGVTRVRDAILESCTRNYSRVFRALTGESDPKTVQKIRASSSHPLPLNITFVGILGFSLLIWPLPLPF